MSPPLSPSPPSLFDYDRFSVGAKNSFRGTLSFSHLCLCGKDLPRHERVNGRSLTRVFFWLLELPLTFSLFLTLLFGSLFT